MMSFEGGRQKRGQNSRVTLRLSRSSDYATPPVFFVFDEGKDSIRPMYNIICVHVLSKSPLLDDTAKDLRMPSLSDGNCGLGLNESTKSRAVSQST